MRFAVIGAGRIGKIHAANVAAHPDCTLVAVVDAIETAAQALASRHGAEASTDPYATIARADIDAIVVGSPTDTHVDLMIACGKAGKAVLCEKPIDLDIKKADAAVAQLAAMKTPAMIAFNRRFDPGMAAVKRAILDGQIGDVRQVIVTSRDPSPPPPSYIASSGGIFRDMTIHDFDLGRWMLGEEPVSVFATGSCLVDPAIGAQGDSDTLMVVMTTKSGKQCHINNCRQASYGYDQRVEVFGSKGMVLNDNLRPSTLRRYSADVTEAQEPLLNFFLERYADAYRIELEAFVQAVKGGAPMPVSAQDGRQALALADAAVESARSGRVVHL